MFLTKFENIPYTLNTLNQIKMNNLVSFIVKNMNWLNLKKTIRLAFVKSVVINRIVSNYNFISQRNIIASY